MTRELFLMLLPFLFMFVVSIIATIIKYKEYKNEEEHITDLIMALISVASVAVFIFFILYSNNPKNISNSIGEQPPANNYACKNINLHQSKTFI